MEVDAMCLAIPMKLIERSELDGIVEIDGVTRQVSLMLLPEAEVGEHVLIHAGYAIGSVDEDEAARTLELLREYADNMEDL
jgi:hydrogenase expression/formation protein HypC